MTEQDKLQLKEQRKAEAKQKRRILSLSRRELSLLAGMSMLAVSTLIVAGAMEEAKSRPVSYAQPVITKRVVQRTEIVTVRKVIVDDDDSSAPTRVVVEPPKKETTTSEPEVVQSAPPPPTPAPVPQTSAS